jgi:hypothetical protein
VACSGRETRCVPLTSEPVQNLAQVVVALVASSRRSARYRATEAHSSLETSLGYGFLFAMPKCYRFRVKFITPSRGGGYGTSSYTLTRLHALYASLEYRALPCGSCAPSERASDNLHSCVPARTASGLGSIFRSSGRSSPSTSRDGLREFSSRSPWLANRPRTNGQVCIFLLLNLC